MRERKKCGESATCPSLLRRWNVYGIMLLKHRHCLKYIQSPNDDLKIKTR
uniref:Uncharacterized protein n=1 Tax=Arundo donax TaxID=35708 RepID=A0A0A8YXH6_ARUDO